MYPKDWHLMWVLVLATAGHLCCCSATEHRAPGPSARKLSHEFATLHHNHLLLAAHQPTHPGVGESVKFSVNGVQHVPAPYARAPAPWRMTATISTPLAGGWGARKPLAKPGSRSRINNRSMTRFSEVEIPAGMEQQLDAPPELLDAASDAAGTTGLVELYRSAERSRGLENLFWKYFVDNDVSASTEDDEGDGDGAGDDGAGINKNALQTTDHDGGESPNGEEEEEEGRKKKFHLKKKYKKFLIPLLLAYKIKFLALVPAIIGGLILLVKSAGLAGFFFALFTAVVSLKKY
uniref:Uncharacterized protein n=1 Tax=Anopheles dirus TaxID=7168 RepID=A0A182NKY7_9DIPT